MTTIPHHLLPRTSTPASGAKSFTKKKAKILQDLAVPKENYHDLSPKDSIDENIRDLIDEINSYDGFVTTSSCAGRISVFLEGEKQRSFDDLPDVSALEPSETSAIKDGSEVGNGSSLSSGKPSDSGAVPVQHGATDRLAAVGGKGGGGRWLFVSHDRISRADYESAVTTFLGMKADFKADSMSSGFEGHRLIHFKFEPMILHVLTASLPHAQMLLSAAMQAGFRESGALNLVASQEAITPMVGIRSMGLALESIVGHLDVRGDAVCMVSPNHLKGLLSIAETRFAENTKRMCRFRDLLKASIDKGVDTTDAGRCRYQKPDGDTWEDPAARKERKRAEGLKRAQELRQQAQQDPSQQLGQNSDVLHM